MNKPKPRCRVRGFVEEMGAFLQRPMCMSLEGERTGLVPITTRTRTGSKYQEWHQDTILAVLPCITIAWP